MNDKINDISIKEISLIKNLWEKNRAYHEETSAYFSQAYQGLCFEDRMKKFDDYSEDTYKISLCKIDEAIVGYCISTISDGIGEVDSIHVESSLRGNGIGYKLVERHLKWMKETKCKSIGVTVSQENETTIGFYKKLGFYPNTLYMQQVT